MSINDNLVNERDTTGRFINGHKYNIGRKHTQKTIERMKKSKVEWHKKQPNFKPMFGKRHTDEAKHKISEKLKGRHAWNKGISMSEETKRKLSESLKGRKSWNKGITGYNTSLKGKPISEEKKEILRISNIGKKLTKEHKSKISKGVKKAVIDGRMTLFWKGKRGENTPAWKGGITPLNAMIRTSLESKNWRHSVFERDKYTCQNCGKHGGWLEAHHIKEFSKYPELRFDVNNGLTLCKTCHKKTKKGR